MGPNNGKRVPGGQMPGKQFISNAILNKYIALGDIRSAAIQTSLTDW